MRAFRLFASVEIAALLALLVVATVMAFLGSGVPGNHATAFQSSVEGAKAFFVATLFLGVIPVVVVGAPIYFALLRHGKPRWIHVILLGIVPGLAAILLDTYIGAFAIICGVIVASLTHVACRRLAPNNSFKPPPLARLN